MKLTFEITVREGALYECYDLVQSQLEDVLEEHFIGSNLGSTNLATDERVSVDVDECGVRQVSVDVDECKIGFA